METDDGAPHWVHSLRAVQAEQDSEYSSDEDECTSDQDDRGPAYESDDDDGYLGLPSHSKRRPRCAHALL